MAGFNTSFEQEQQWGGSTYTPRLGQVTKSQLTQQPTDSGMTDAQTSAVGAGIGAASDVTSAIISGVATVKDNEEARTQARELANISRADRLRQQQISNRQQAEADRQEKEAFKIQQTADTITNQFNDFMKAFKDKMEKRRKATRALGQLNALAMKDENLKNTLVNMWGV